VPAAYAEAHDPAILEIDSAIGEVDDALVVGREDEGAPVLRLIRRISRRMREPVR
jgi:hypothetical protein